MIVPLKAHGRSYGALSLFYAESARRFTEMDLPLVEDVGRRAGLAVHNASIYRSVVKANELLERQTSQLEQQTDEARALADELEAQANELVRANEELKLKTQEAAAANKAKSEFLASMSHELRTPLNAIAGYVDILEMGLRGPVTTQQRADLNRIKQSQKHLLGLINDILNYAKIDAGRLEYRIERMSLDRALVDCEAMVLPQIHAKHISYTYEECGHPVFVYADPEKVQQILLNLLSNAIKFTPEGGRITASCSKTDSAGRVQVKDNGIGIEPGKLETIFEPFGSGSLANCPCAIR
jgi:signal transduction histidine kinase